MKHNPLGNPEYEAYIQQFHNIFPDRAVAEKYLEDAIGRVTVVMEWMKELNDGSVRKVLELGSNPYNLTLLLKKYFKFELSLANFFGKAEDNGRHTQIVEGGGERHEFTFDHFNLETDPYPYPDGYFDCVLFCEILEHLLLSPDFAVSEMNRILRPGGYILVTTPNMTRLANLVWLARGKNINDGYSPHGIYGRHNREYTVKEIVELLQRHSFRVIKTSVRNIYFHPWKSRFLASLRPNIWYEHSFVLGVKEG